MARILFLSDIYGNLDALKAVIDKVPYDTAFCLGDLADYGPEPAECIDWIRRNGIVTVMGNHDNAVAFKVDCGCGYTYKHLSVATREYTWGSLGEKDIEFLKKLPLLIEKNVDGIKITLAHGSPKSFFDYIYPDSPVEHINGLTAGISGDYLAVGHTHKPMQIASDGLKIINPGSVGQPRDGDIRASCLLLDTTTEEVNVIRVEYDVEAVRKRIRKAMPHAEELERILMRGY